MRDARELDRLTQDQARLREIAKLALRLLEPFRIFVVEDKRLIANYSNPREARAVVSKPGRSFWCRPFRPRLAGPLELTIRRAVTAHFGTDAQSLLADQVTPPRDVGRPCLALAKRCDWMLGGVRGRS
jgi:hypothetical protein